MHKNTKKQRILNPIKISEQELMQELQHQQIQLTKIQKQRELIQNIQGIVVRKDREITKLKELVQKYQPNYQQFAQLRLEVADKQSSIKTLQSQNQFLRRQFQQLLKQCQTITERQRQLERQRQVLVRQRHGIERMNQQIEQTFRQYRQQCKLRQNDLIAQTQQLSRQNLNLQKIMAEIRQSHQISQIDSQEIHNLKERIDKLQNQLAERDSELVKNKKLNHELSVQFDKSVNKIVEFQHELNDYRRDNHELKKTLGLVLEQQKYNKIRSKYVSGANNRDAGEEEDDLSEDDSSEDHNIAEQSSPQFSQVRF